MHFQEMEFHSQSKQFEHFSSGQKSSTQILHLRALLIKTDVKNFFPSVDRQLVFDVLADLLEVTTLCSVTLCIKKGEEIPSKPSSDTYYLLWLLHMVSLSK